MSTEKKTINYNGMELECITEGYWPDGVTLVGTDNGSQLFIFDDAVCLRLVRAIDKNWATSAHWRHWAILPPKPAPRRLTKCEAYRLWRKGWDYKNVSGRVTEPCYMDSDRYELTHQGSNLRAPNSDEWLEPTSDLLEVGE